VSSSKQAVRVEKSTCEDLTCDFKNSSALLCSNIEKSVTNNKEFSYENHLQLLTSETQLGNA
jgi:hypothetical protein